MIRAEDILRSFLQPGIFASSDKLVTIYTRELFHTIGQINSRARRVASLQLRSVCDNGSEDKLSRAQETGDNIHLRIQASGNINCQFIFVASLQVRPVPVQGSQVRIPESQILRSLLGGIWGSLTNAVTILYT